MYATLNNAGDYLVGAWTVFLILFWGIAGFRAMVCEWTATLGRQGRFLFCCGWRLRGAWHGTGVRRERG